MPSGQDLIDMARRGVDQRPYAQRVASDVSWSPGNMRNRIAAYLGGQMPIPGQDTSAEGLSRMESFDPTAAMDTYATGAYNQIFNQVGGIGDQLKRLQGSSVAGGRFNTGFRTRDAGQIMSRGIEDLDTALAGGALQATGMRQRNIEDIYGAGEDAQNRYLRMLLEAEGRSSASKQYADAQNAAMWGDISSAAGDIFSMGATKGAKV